MFPSRNAEGFPASGTPSFRTLSTPPAVVYTS